MYEVNCIHANLMLIIYFFMQDIFLIIVFVRTYYVIDTITNTMHASVDTSMNVAAAVVNKGTLFIGSAKGILCSFASLLALKF